MIDALVEPFRQGIMQRALVEIVVLGAVCGALGCWVLFHRQSYAAESMAHGMLPGLVLGALAGLPLALGAGGGVLAAALLVSLFGRDPRIGGDVAVAVTVTALFGAGALLALAPDAPARLEELLFGDLLGVGPADLLVAVALAGAILLALAVWHRRLLLAAFDPVAAPSLGSRPARAELVLLILLALAVVAAVQALGNLLVVALLIAPAAAARRFTARVVPMLALAAGLGAGAGLLGLYASYHLAIAAGAAVALAAVGAFAVSLLVAPRHGNREPGRRSPVAALARSR